MLFAKEYDRALWLILMSDKENREIIKKFIQNIPKELYMKLIASLKKYNDLVDVNSDLKCSKSELYFCGEQIDDKNELYSFYINPKDGVLSLSKHVLNDIHHYYCEIEVSIVPINFDFKKNNTKLIGEFSYALDKEKFSGLFGIEDYGHIKYEFKGNSYGNIVMLQSIDLPSTKKRVRRINKKKMKDNFDMFEIDSIKF